MHQASDVRRARIQVLVVEGSRRDIWTRGSSSPRRRLCSVPGRHRKACRSAQPRAAVQAQGCRGEHHRPLRVYKPVPRSLGPIQTASANQTPERDPHPQSNASISLIHTPRKPEAEAEAENLRGSARKPGFSHENWTDANVQVYSTLLKTKTIERTECTKDSVGKQPGRAECPSNGQGRPGSKDHPPPPRPHPALSPRAKAVGLSEGARLCWPTGCLYSPEPRQAGGTQFSSRTASPELRPRGQQPW